MSATPLTPEQSQKIRNMGILCAFLVVLIHCRPKFDYGTFGWWVKEFLQNGVTHIAVPFFFIVSGYMLARDLKGGYKAAITKRARSLLLPFVLWNVLFWLFSIALQNIDNLVNGREMELWIPTVSQFGLWYTDCPLLTPLWYIRALFVLACISPVLLCCTKRFSYWFLLILLVIYGFICPFAPMSGWTGLRQFARVGLFPVLGLFYFTLGIAIHEGMLEPYKFIELGRGSGFFSLLVGVILIVIRAIFAYMNIPYSYYLGFLSIPFMLYGLWSIVSCKELPKWLVSCSFGVYLIHKFVLLVLKSFINVNSSVIAYVGCAIIAFSASIAIVIELRMCMPCVAKVLFGGR